ncbi:MAG: hypothetical protein FJZ04_03800 [Candidatus Moranbacteria bacterium]|nr:hypothetical protein [Candidatus Moranbacteria bacterium]
MQHGFSPISMAELALLRVRMGIRNSFTHKIRIGEAFVYYPNGDIVITHRALNPLIRMISEGIRLESRKLDCHCGYRLDDSLARELRKRAVLDSEIALETGALLMPFQKSSSAYDIETVYMSEDMVARFLFGEALEDYKRCLRSDRMVLKPNHPNPFAHMCDPEFMRGVQDYILGKREDLPYGNEKQVIPDWVVDLGGIEHFYVWRCPQTRWAGVNYDFAYACCGTALSPKHSLSKVDMGIDGTNGLVPDHNVVKMIGFKMPSEEQRFKAEHWSPELVEKSKEIIIRARARETPLLDATDIRSILSKSNPVKWLVGWLQ